jgi:hypothetical protein
MGHNVRANSRFLAVRGLIEDRVKSARSRHGHNDPTLPVIPRRRARLAAGLHLELAEDRRDVVANRLLGKEEARRGENNIDLTADWAGAEASDTVTLTVVRKHSAAELAAIRERRAERARERREQAQREHEQQAQREQEQQAQREQEQQAQREQEQQAQQAQDCHPSYQGACLDPNASDYDCEGGSGDGPEYTGPVQVVGPDDYDLDRDGDGSACES